MQEDTRRAVKEGLAYGSVAGVLFGTMEIAGATLMGDPPVMPLRMFASVVWAPRHSRRRRLAGS